MQNYTLTDFALQIGGSLARVDDLGTGEVLFDREHPAEQLPRGRKEHGSSAGGLSTYHISPQASYYEGASLLKVSKNIPAEPNPHGYKKRGKASFSRASRRRLVRTLAMTKRDQKPLFVTLTYPGEWPSNPREWKRHLDNFIKRLVRAFPGAAGIWKLEPQKRGAPHFHLLVWGIDYIYLRSYVGPIWYAVVNSGDIRHLHAGTRVERIHSQQGVMWYASKYLGKEVKAEWGDVGRWWGCFARENMPFGALVQVDITAGQCQTIIRYMRRFARVRSRDYKALTVICHANQWVQRLI